MIFNIQVKHVPVKELVQASLLILRVRNIHQKCHQPLQVNEMKSYAEFPAFLDYYCPFLPLLYIFHHPYSWLLVYLHAGGGDTVGIKSHLSAQKRKWCEGSKRAEISTGWLRLGIYLYQYSSLYQVKQLFWQEITTDCIIIQICKSI